MIEILSRKFQPLFVSMLYQTVIAKMAYLNVLAIAPQTYMALTATSVNGISTGMWAIFATIQIIFLLEAIRMKSKDMAGSMLLSIPQSLTIIAAVYIRG